MKKILALIIFIIIGFGATGYGFYYKKSSKIDQNRTNEVISNTPTFTPTIAPTMVPEKSNKIVLTAAGDIACNTAKTKTTCFQQETSAVIEKINPDYVIALGDLQYPKGSTSDFNKYYAPSWGKFKSKTFAVPGNHEYETLHAKSYFDYMGSEFNYYSKDLNNWHVIGLNSNCGSFNVKCDKESEQYKWLENDLKNNTKPCILAFWHAPLFSSGKHGSFAAVKPFWDLLYQSKASVVLNGHDHIYERFAKQDPDGKRDKNGIQQFIAGTGGYSLYEFDNIGKNSEFKQNKEFGILKLELEDNKYSWEFINTDNKTVDKGQNSCSTKDLDNKAK